MNTLIVAERDITLDADGYLQSLDDWSPMPWPPPKALR